MSWDTFLALHFTSPHSRTLSDLFLPVFQDVIMRMGPRAVVLTLISWVTVSGVCLSCPCNGVQMRFLSHFYLLLHSAELPAWKVWLGKWITCPNLHGRWVVTLRTGAWQKGTIRRWYRHTCFMLNLWWSWQPTCHTGETRPWNENVVSALSSTCLLRRNRLQMVRKILGGKQKTNNIHYITLMTRSQTD